MGAFRIFRRLQDLLDVNPAGLADNDIPTWDAATQKFTMEAGGGGGGGGAPTTADYLVGTADATLSNEIVVGATPGGELGGTWAAPTVDTVHSGSSHAATQAAAEATAAAGLSAHVTDATDAHDASAISNVPAGTIAATDVQAALNELDGQITTSLSDAVILAPASSARNVIQPTAGGVIAAIVKAHAAQSVDIFRVEDSAGLGYVRVGLAGTLAVGGVTGNDLATYGVYPIAAVISRGGTYYDADGGPAMTPGNAQAAVLSFFDQELLPTVDTSLGGFGIGSSSRLGLTTRPIDTLQGTFVEAINRGTRASGTPQIGRAFGVTGWVGYYDGAATGDITLAAGINGEVIHYGAGVIADGAIFYSDPQSFQGSTGPITRLHGLLLGNMGRAGVATSYGIRVRAQSGADTASYAVVVEGGKSLFTSGLVIALIAAPADAAYANGEGGWWWDQANSLPKWKGKTSGGVVVNATPYVVSGTDVALADGGTGASLVDPGADRIMFWDDSAGVVTWLTPGTNLSITGTTLDAAGGGGGSVATDAIWDAKGDLAAGTGADAAVRVAAGTNFLDVLTPDSSTSTGLRWGYKRSGLRPTSALYETMSRGEAAPVGTTYLATTRLHMVAIDLPVGLLVTSITFINAGQAAVTPLNQLFGLYDSSRNLLRGSNDDTTTAWPTNTAKTLTLTSTFTTTYSGLHYLGILVVATTVPNGMCVAPALVVMGVTPIISGTSDTAITALPNPAAAITATSTKPWAWVN